MPRAACPPSLRLRQRRLGVPQALASLALVGGLLVAAQPASAQGRAIPQAPESKPPLFDPDPGTCNPDSMRTAFQRQLEPYRDQDAAVLKRLQAVQADMTLSSLRRCVRRGLMTEEQAVALGRELGLIAPAASGGPQRDTTPSTRP